MKKLLRGSLYALLILTSLLAVLLYVKRPHTPAIRDENGRRPPHAVSRLMTLSLGGVDQWISIRGHDTSNPVLLFLHGGPGMPMMFLAHAFQRPLEEHFVCVQWDQRGAGKSFRPDLAEDGLSVRRLLDDLYELVGVLTTWFGKQKIILAGHSFGSYLGMLAVREHPELFEVYIGIGQVVDDERTSALQDRFIRKEAAELGVPEAIADLDRDGPAAHEKWLFRFRAELRASRGYRPFVKAGVLAPEYGLFDILKVAKGSAFSSIHMRYDVIEGPLMDNVREVRVPVYFLMGQYDQVTPLALVEEYVKLLEAPHKQIILFRRSAHFPFFEEPGSFARALKAVRDAHER
jgi:pimeloyl-ACP methyl ester carboxylesterase